MTPSLCQEICTTGDNEAKHYTYFSLFNSTWCECSTTLLPTYELDRYDPDECNFPCSGDKCLYCGGKADYVVGQGKEKWWFQRKTHATKKDVYAAPAEQRRVGMEKFAGGWGFSTCWHNDEDPRASDMMDGDYMMDPDMTVASCASFCNGLNEGRERERVEAKKEKKKGKKGKKIEDYHFMGLKGGDTCLCSERFIDKGRYSGDYPEGKCNTQCQGDEWAFCGGDEAIQLYEKCNGDTTECHDYWDVTWKRKLRGWF